MHCTPRELAMATITPVWLMLLTSTPANRVSATPLISVRTVALSNDAFPGVPGGVVVEQFAQPRVDANGRVAFKARLLHNVGGTVFGNDTAIWSEVAPDDLRFVAREGDQLPNLNYRFDEVEPGENLRMSGSGSIYFLAGMTRMLSPANGSSGIFQFSPAGGLEIMAVSSPLGEGSITTVEGPGSFFTNFLDFNEAGDIAMQTGHGFGSIYALESIAGMNLLNIVAPSGSFPAINEFGDVVFRIRGDPLMSQIAVWNRSAFIPKTVAFEGGPAADAGGAMFRKLGDEDTFSNADGDVTFIAQLMGSGISDANDFGLWMEQGRGGPLKLFLREGDPAPGTGANVVWSGFNQFSVPATFGRGGGIALRLELAGPDVLPENDSGVWAGTEIEGLHLVAREGDPAPGTEFGTVFSQINKIGVTRDGRGVFHAYLSGSGLDPNRNLGIWAEDVHGVLRLIARHGDSVTIPGGVVAQITSIDWDQQFSVGERGHIAFTSVLSNGVAAVFVSNLVAVPETNALLICSIGAFAVATSKGCRRRKR